VSFLKLLMLFFKSFPRNVECFMGSLKIFTSIIPVLTLR
jgi:hypothetical protein